MKHTPPVILMPLPLAVRASMIAEALADAQLAARLHDRKAGIAFISRLAELLGVSHAATLPEVFQQSREFVASRLHAKRDVRRGGKSL